MISKKAYIKKLELLIGLLEKTPVSVPLVNQYARDSGFVEKDYESGPCHTSAENYIKEHILRRVSYLSDEDPTRGDWWGYEKETFTFLNMLYKHVDHIAMIRETRFNN